jgi:hypothetical protein
MIVALTIGALAMIKGVQLMTLVWLLLFAKIAYEDVQTKSYPLYFGLVFMLSSLLLRMLSGEVESVLVDLLGGGAILGLSGMLKRHVGSGDTVVMLGMLIACGLRACGHTFFLAAVFGVILSCFTMNPEKQKEVAFIPLLFMGMMVYKLME